MPKKEPLFPHVPKRHEPLFPHVTKGQRLPESDIKRSAKEPWMMTREGFEKHRESSRKAFDAFTVSLNADMKINPSLKYMKAGELQGFSEKTKTLYLQTIEAGKERAELLKGIRSQAKSEGVDPELVMWDIMTDSPKMHEVSVRTALSKGKPVPSEVLADYPDLKPQTIKEPWQMTRDEFGFGDETDWPLKVSFKGQLYGKGALEVWHKENYGKAPHFRTPNAAQEWVDKTHKRLLQQALSEGKPVPHEVLKDYPELAKR